MRHIRILFIIFVVILWVTPAHALKLPKLHGFVEGAYGFRVRHNDTTKHNTYNMLEQRLQIKTSYFPEIPILEKMYTEVNFKGDLLVDEYNQGKISYNIRETNIFVSPLDWLDIKIGRQIFTWGTGDYIFINDVFPKDYLSFFMGREDEYLKKPSDGIKASIFSKVVNVDLVVIPFFEANTVAQGDIHSFFDMFQGGIAGRESTRFLDEPPRKPRNTELAGRLYRNFGSYETALYAFRGFYKNPQGVKVEPRRVMFYPRLNVYGASIRGPLLGGIANVETGYYDSADDEGGRSRLIPNSVFKYLLGYEKDLGSDLTVGVQYLSEQMIYYDRYKGSLMSGDSKQDRFRHLVTARITQLAMSQTMKATLFAFYSPTDEDIYFRPVFEYNITDQWKLALGGNIVWGDENDTEFGQMRKNSNIYTRLRYSF